MKIDQFFHHFHNELELNPALYPYYKLNRGSDSVREFRKNYFIQRLSYIDNQIDKSNHPVVMDCGCGYGTTCLYLAMNGIATKGTTLEYYFQEIENRKKYWSQYGDSELFSWNYENIFDNPPAPESFDYIILQDTLHHIEPVDKALTILYNALKKGGKLILIEINGSCLLESLIYFMKRGNKRIINFYDDKLKKTISMGNENFRSEKKWRNLFKEAGFDIDHNSVQYIRFLLPFFYKKNNGSVISKVEQKIASHYSSLKKYGFFGLNMVFTK